MVVYFLNVKYFSIKVNLLVVWMPHPKQAKRLIDYEAKKSLQRTAFSRSGDTCDLTNS